MSISVRSSKCMADKQTDGIQADVAYAEAVLGGARRNVHDSCQKDQHTCSCHMLPVTLSLTASSTPAARCQHMCSVIEAYQAKRSRLMAGQAFWTWCLASPPEQQGSSRGFSDQHCLRWSTIRRLPALVPALWCPLKAASVNKPAGRDCLHQVHTA